MSDELIKEIELLNNKLTVMSASILFLCEVIMDILPAEGEADYTRVHRKSYRIVTKLLKKQILKEESDEDENSGR